MEILKSLREEQRAQYLYKVIAENEKNILHKKLFADLSQAANKQANIWSEKIRAQGLQVPPFFPDLRTRIMSFLIKWIGVRRARSMLAAMKVRGMSLFVPYHPEYAHSSFNVANNLRAVVFGISDGLISNLSLIVGIAAANSSQHFIILTGIAGLLAGACSMASGEYVSVRTQREVFEHQIAIEKEELAEYPEEEMQELSLIYEARSIPKEDAQKLAALMIANPETALNTLVREELGLNPEDIGSPFSAMMFSFVSFSIGALIPILPFLWSNKKGAILMSLFLTAIALLIVGICLSLFTHKSPFKLGMRMLLFGSIAGGITFIIGHLFKGYI